MKHGCCLDKKCSPTTCMELPTGKTCGDCRSFQRCKGFLGRTGQETSCDWFPRVFRENQDNRIKELEIAHVRYEAVRKLNPVQFTKLCQLNISSGIAFDRLVDGLAKGEFAL